MNVETLIQEVRNRPVIWDVNHEHYNDRFRTQLAWYNICTVLLENFRQKSKIEKSNISKYNFTIFLLVRFQNKIFRSIGF